MSITGPRGIAAAVLSCIGLSGVMPLTHARIPERSLAHPQLGTPELLDEELLRCAELGPWAEIDAECELAWAKQRQVLFAAGSLYARPWPNAAAVLCIPKLVMTDFCSGCNSAPADRADR